MCVIIINKDKKIIQDDILVKSATINPHGLGITWLDTYETEFFKSEEYCKLRTDRPYVAHFRFATVGKISRENTHPFTITGTDCLLYQNGSVLNLGYDDKTDAQHMADILGRANPQDWGDILEMTDCRWVIVDTKQETVDVYNEEMFIDNAGIQYSKQNVLDGELVAVYGTLKEGLGNHSVLGLSKLVGEGRTVNKYPMVDSGIPYVYPEKGVGHNCKVEVHMVEKDQLEGPIDSLEGHPSHYKREKTLIKLDSGDTITAWLYFGQRQRDPNDPLIDEYVRVKRESSLSLWGDHRLDAWHDDTPYDAAVDAEDDLDGCVCDTCGGFDTKFDDTNNALWCYECQNYVTSQDIIYNPTDATATPTLDMKPF